MISLSQFFLLIICENLENFFSHVLLKIYLRLMTINSSYTLLTMLLNGSLKSTTNSLSPVITSLVVQPLIKKCRFSSMESVLYSCGNLNVICPHKPIGSGTIERCDFGVCMTLLEKVSHSRGGF